jgi:hypothetical protein
MDVVASAQRSVPVVASENTAEANNDKHSNVHVNVPLKFFQTICAPYHTAVPHSNASNYAPRSRGGRRTGRTRHVHRFDLSPLQYLLNYV